MKVLRIVNGDKVSSTGFLYNNLEIAKKKKLEAALADKKEEISPKYGRLLTKDGIDKR